MGGKPSESICLLISTERRCTLFAIEIYMEWSTMKCSKSDWNEGSCWKSHGRKQHERVTNKKGDESGSQTRH